MCVLILVGIFFYLVVSMCVTLDTPIYPVYYTTISRIRHRYLEINTEHSHTYAKENPQTHDIYQTKEKKQHGMKKKLKPRHTAPFPKISDEAIE